MNYYDRYLSHVKIEKKYVELLAWICLHLASSEFEIHYRSLSLVGRLIQSADE